MTPVTTELRKKLSIIITTAQRMQLAVSINELANIKKQMDEIEQYVRLVRFDVDYLTQETKEKE